MYVFALTVGFDISIGNLSMIIESHNQIPHAYLYVTEPNVSDQSVLYFFCAQLLMCTGVCSCTYPSKEVYVATCLIYPHNLFDHYT